MRRRLYRFFYLNTVFHWLSAPDSILLVRFKEIFPQQSQRLYLRQLWRTSAPEGPVPTLRCNERIEDKAYQYYGLIVLTSSICI